MEQSKKDWLGYLDLYGADFGRWPIRLSKQQEQEVMDMPEYAGARNIDAALGQVEWPAPSQNMKKSVLERIRLIEEESLPMMVPPSFFYVVNRPAFIATFFVLFLCLGVTSGARYNTEVRDNVDYSYFSLGPAYAYASNAGDEYDQ